MKKLMFLLAGFFYLTLAISCGEDNFDPYKDEGYDKAKGLLPVKITETMELTGGLPPIVTTTEFEYDENDRISSSRITFGSFIYTQNISYNETNGSVKSVMISYGTSENYTYTYDYPEDNTILEHKSKNGTPLGSSTITLSWAKRIITKNSPDKGIINYVYDSRGNVTQEGLNIYTYDTTKGLLSATKTPHWLFLSLQNELPYSHNIINNATLNEDGDTYEYTKFNHSQYPVKGSKNGSDYIVTIDYKLTNRF